VILPLEEGGCGLALSSIGQHFVHTNFPRKEVLPAFLARVLKPIFNNMRYHEYKKIPNGLRKHRLAANLTQKQIADILGIEQEGKIALWENGSRLPNLITAFKLAAIHSVYVEALFYDLMDTIRHEVKPRVGAVLDSSLKK
jgi:DNA-binding XRE family transcriptional regulator